MTDHRTDRLPAHRPAPPAGVDLVVDEDRADSPEAGFRTTPDEVRPAPPAGVGVEAVADQGRSVQPAAVEAAGDEGRIERRAADLLPEERAAGSDDPDAQAAAILADSDDRTDGVVPAQTTTPLDGTR